VLPLTDPEAAVKVAVMVVVPDFLPVAKPLALVIEATVDGEDVHLATLDMS